MNRSTALLVIDVQQAAFDGALMAPIHRPAELLERTSELIAAARAARIPVVFIQHDGPAGDPFAEGTEGARIQPDVAPIPGDALIHKRRSSAFEDTPLESLLSERGVDTVITCGLQSDFCVANTSLGALARGLDVYVAGDAHSTWSTETDQAPDIIAAQNERLRDAGGRVESTAALARLLRAL